DIVNLPGSASVTYTATCSISPSATGTLSNTATVTFAGDPNPANDSATDTDTLSPQADLAITKTDGVTTALAGGAVTYTITASNAGPSDAPGATVTDTFPGTLTCTWTCGGAGGGTCTASGSGNIADTVNLPVGGSVTYTASCTIDPAATGTLSNTATVAAPGGVTDPTPGNNSATDTDTVLLGNYFTVTPCRLADTRNADGPYGGPSLNGGATRTFVAAGQCGVPAGATALSYNITVTEATADGDLRIYPAGITPPLVSVINYRSSQNRANNGITILGAGGDFVVESDQPSGTVQVIIDVNGYFR
ncbi:MAG TPA: DUF11 domain-containing protein, partial [Thermoanaerobaculia bacterium]|nr:DUF11 domain-containing protein [Thermoanaerobaculia bacterium]